MKNITINISVCIKQDNELSQQDLLLVNQAKEATFRSYAPYSHFYVGAAVLLSNGVIVTGSNQENAAYPSGTCAERTTVFYANSQYPDQSITKIAVAARGTDGNFLTGPIPPCGACRQVLIEYEKKGGCNIEVMLYGTAGTYCLQSVKDLLPLTFDESYL